MGSRASPSGSFPGDLAQSGCDRRFELVQPFAAVGRHGDDGRLFEERAAQRLGHVGQRQLSQRSSVVAVGDEVALGQRHHAARDAEQAADVEVLARLRHHALVGGDDEHDQIDADRAGHHRAHEALVSRHVDHPDRLARGQRQVREAELDGDAALLLFLQAIGVDPGERAHQRRLAVVDVTGGADDARERGGHAQRLLLERGAQRQAQQIAVGDQVAVDAAQPRQQVEELLLVATGVDQRPELGQRRQVGGHP